MAFTAAASGRKLKLLILIPRKKSTRNFRLPENVIVIYGTSGNFNENVLKESIIQRVLVPYKLAENLAELNLVFLIKNDLYLLFFYSFFIKEKQCN